MRSSPRARAGYGAGGTAGTHQGVYFIDEQDNLSVAVDHLLHDSLEPFLELSLIFRTGYERSHVEGEHLAVLQVLGHLPVDYLLGYALGNRGLAHSGFADQDGVVLCAPAQYLQDSPYLLVPAYHGVEFPFSRGLVEVDGVFA